MLCTDRYATYRKLKDDMKVRLPVAIAEGDGVEQRKPGLAEGQTGVRCVRERPIGYLHPGYCV